MPKCFQKAFKSGMLKVCIALYRNKEIIKKLAVTQNNQNQAFTWIIPESLAILFDELSNQQAEITCWEK